MATKKNPAAVALGRLGGLKGKMVFLLALCKDPEAVFAVPRECFLMGMIGRIGRQADRLPVGG